MKKLLLLLCLLPFAALAQSTIKPDCIIPVNFTTTNVTSNLTCGNNTLGIANWVFVYSSTGFSALSIVVQSAPDAGGTPGSWGTFGGTVLTNVQYPGSSGINPNTSATSANTGFAGYFPWVRVNLASITGTGRVTGVLYGFLNSTLAKAGSGGGGGGGGPTITGNANRIVVAGAGCTSPSTATCNIDIPSNAAFPGAPTTTTAALGDSSTKIATTAFVNNAFAGCTFITGALSCPGPISAGVGSGTTGALDLVGSTSSATSTVTVDATNTATVVKLPNDATSGLYVVTSPSATPTSGRCAQFNGTGTQIAPAPAACGTGSGGTGATVFSTTNSTTVTQTSPTTLIGTVTGSTTVAANTFAAGQILEVVAQGFYSTPVTPASLTITLNIGGTIRLTTGAVVQIASVTSGVWRVWCAVTTRTAGVSGTQIANCIFEGTGVSLTPAESPMQTSSTWTIDTTSTQAIDVLATWSTATGAPTITSTNVAAWFPGNSSSGGGAPGGSAGQWQANNAGSFGGLTGTSILPVAGWTIQNAAVFNNFSTAEIGVYVLDNSSLNWRFITRAVPGGGTYTLAATLLCLPPTSSNSSTCDFGLSDGTKYENYEILYQAGSSAGANNLRIEQLTNTGTDGGPAFAATKGLTTSYTSFCIVEDGTHRTWSHYSNGAWVQDLQEATGTFLTPTLLAVGGLSATNDAGKFMQTNLKYLFTSTGTTCP